MRDYLKKLREAKKLSMQEAAEKIGISRQYYQMIEAGERQRKMDITLITALAALFSVTVEDLVQQETNYINTEELK